MNFVRLANVEDKGEKERSELPASMGAWGEKSGASMLKSAFLGLCQEQPDSNR